MYSVLMALYANDNCDYFIEAIESVLKQTIMPNQIVLVVDGPIYDELNECINEYVNKYNDLFLVLYLPINKGLANALNEGIKLCKNELIARMDSDDISLPNRCEVILKEFEENSNLSVCGCNIKEFFKVVGDSKNMRCVPKDYDDILRFSRRRQPFNHPTVIYKKSVIEECGGYPELKRKEDFDLFSILITNGYYVKNVDQVLYLYRANMNNYRRRKSINNFKAAMCVYYRHFKRGGCNLFDLFVMCLGELVFLSMPYSIMRVVSDKLLRKRDKNENIVYFAENE